MIPEVLTGNWLLRTGLALGWFMDAECWDDCMGEKS